MLLVLERAVVTIFGDLLRRSSNLPPMTGNGSYEEKETILNVVLFRETSQGRLTIQSCMMTTTTDQDMSNEVQYGGE